MLISVKTDRITNHGNQRVVKFSDNPELCTELERVLNERGMFIQIIPVDKPSFFWKAADFSVTVEPVQDADVPDGETEYSVGNDTNEICKTPNFGIYNTTKTVASDGVSETKAAKNLAALNFINGKVDCEWLADMILKYWKMDALPYEDHSEDDPPYVIPEEHRRHFYVYQMKSFVIAPTVSKTPSSLLIIGGATKGYGGTSSVFPSNPDKNGWRAPLV